jgi:hypothetical protein
VLEQAGRAACHAHASVDQTRRSRAALTLAEQGIHDLDRLVCTDRAQLEQLVTRAADITPALVTRQELRARQTDDDDRPFQIFDQVAQQLERVFICDVYVLAHEAKRTALRVALDEAAQNGAAHQARL